MSTYRMTIEYDGTNFAGWQFQKNGRSVQEVIEKAMFHIMQVPLRIAGGGRTDAGVHATGQVASFHFVPDLDIKKLERGMNAVLPADVAVSALQKTEDDFHARFSAKGRRYEYRVASSRAVIGRLFCWSVYQALDLEAMERAAHMITGEHDFRAFCKTTADAEHYRCIVDFARWSKSESGFLFSIQANRFMHGMVRALVGTMVDIGRGSTLGEKFEAILNSHDRSTAGMSAPAKGLCLKEIIY
ncbi:MAG: tRNA pseudouridine(38-40) synthase TruA [Bacteroidota bacterium]